MLSWQRGRAYSQDLRERVLVANELSARAAADRFGVSVSCVIKARQRRDRLGELTPGPQRRGRRANWLSSTRRSVPMCAPTRMPRWPNYAPGY